MLEIRSIIATHLERVEKLSNMNMKDLRELIHDLPDDMTVQEYFQLSPLY